MMRVLLSAYACEPHKGSEPEVGWRWGLALAEQGQDIIVLTRSNNRRPIELFFKSHADKTRPTFIYYDCPNWLRRFKKLPGGIYGYYLCWQWGAYRAAKRLHYKHKFDVVHHVTFVSVRQPSFMGLLGTSFIFGPVAGGERAPWRLRLSYGLKGWLIDLMRDVANVLVKLDPLMWLTFASADKIMVTSKQTKKLLPKCYQSKTAVELAIGIGDPSGLLRTKHVASYSENSNKLLTILFVGRFIYWKGMDIGLKAFAKFSQQSPNARLLMVGKGPAEKRWRNLARRYKITDKITWIPWCSQEQLQQYYQQADLLLNPSLHDSGGMVVLEALSNSLPVVCLKLGGPGRIVTDDCGGVIKAHGSGDEVAREIASVMTRIVSNPDKYALLRVAAQQQAAQFTWQGKSRNFLKEVLNG